MMMSGDYNHETDDDDDYGDDDYDDARLLECVARDAASEARLRLTPALALAQLFALDRLYVQLTVTYIRVTYIRVTYIHE